MQNIATVRFLAGSPAPNISIVLSDNDARTKNGIKFPNLETQCQARGLGQALHLLTFGIVSSLVVQQAHGFGHALHRLQSPSQTQDRLPGERTGFRQDSVNSNT